MQYGSEEDINYLVRILYEETFIKAFKKDENDVDIGPTKDLIFSLFE